MSNDGLSVLNPIISAILSLGLILAVGLYFYKRPKNSPRGLTERGKEILLSNIPVLNRLPDAQKNRVYDIVSKLKRSHKIQRAYRNVSNGWDRFEFNQEDQAVLFGYIALLMMHRRGGMREGLFPIAVTEDQRLENDPIIIGKILKGSYRTVRSSDISLNDPLSRSGFSPWLFQIAKFLDAPELIYATIEHRREFESLIIRLDGCYQRMIMSSEQSFEDTNTDDVPQSFLSPLGFLEEALSGHLGGASNVDFRDEELQEVLQAFYGQQKILH